MCGASAHVTGRSSVHGCLGLIDGVCVDRGRYVGVVRRFGFAQVFGRQLDTQTLGELHEVLTSPAVAKREGDDNGLWVPARRQTARSADEFGEHRVDV